MLTRREDSVIWYRMATKAASLAVASVLVALPACLQASGRGSDDRSSTGAWSISGGSTGANSGTGTGGSAASTTSGGTTGTVPTLLCSPGILSFNFDTGNDEATTRCGNQNGPVQNSPATLTTRFSPSTLQCSVTSQEYIIDGGAFYDAWVIAVACSPDAGTDLEAQTDKGGFDVTFSPWPP